MLLERNIFRRNNVEQLTGYYPAAVKIFNQSHRVTCRDNLVIDNPYSNGIWYDVGNRDGVFVDNWVEGALDGFFFEISKGAIVRRQRVRRLRQGRPRPQQLERARLPQHVRRHRRLLRAQREERGRRPLRLAPAAPAPTSTQREGHVFVGNLLVASESFRKPLLRFEQPKALCAQLTRPQATEVDGNVYVRAGSGGPLLVWSPVAGESCQVELGSLEDLRRLQPGFEARGRFLSGYVGRDLPEPRAAPLRAGPAAAGTRAAARRSPAEVGAAARLAARRAADAGGVPAHARSRPGGRAQAERARREPMIQLDRQ